MKECITVNDEVRKRMLVLGKVDRGSLTASGAATVLGRSLRQVRRLQAAYRAEGVAGLVHGNQGVQPAHTIPEEVRRQVVALALDPRYVGANHQHFSELLAEREHLSLSRSTVRRILLAGGLRSPRRRRAPQHRSRRERMAQAGMLLQWDGSTHDWVQGRGPKLTLVGAIDDATGVVSAAHFRDHEDAHGYLLVLQDVVTTYGVPLAVYRDRHGIFERRPQEAWSLEEDLAGERDRTQVGRCLTELGIQSIAAYSPQAKGRIERLWGTLQDRLVLELRLAGATTLAEAEAVLQAYLPRFNAQFAIAAAADGSAYRPLPAGLEVTTVCCFKYQRTVAMDNTVQLGEYRLQIQPDADRRSYARATVEVHERLDGSLAVYSQGRCLVTTTAPQEAQVLRARGGRRVSVAGAGASDAAAVITTTPVGKWATGAPLNARSAPAVVHLSTGATPPHPRQDHPWRRRFKRPEDRITEQLE